MLSALSEALRQAAELQKQMWKAYESIYAALGYSEVPAEHVIDAVGKAVEHAAAALGNVHGRAQFFRVRKALEQKRARILAEEDQCPFCGEPLDAADDHGVRECPECWTKFDRSVNELHL
jgi:DNA repair exonuclease SbcCD ATPase subunit